LITRLCARILQSTKEDNVMSDSNQPPRGQTNKPAIKPYKGRVKVKYLTPEEAREFNQRMGIPSSYLVIGNTIKEGSK
jgi:hypothetical protein